MERVLGFHSEGAGPLHLLAGTSARRAYVMAQVLLSRGADPNQKCKEGLTPVHVAAAWGEYEMLKLLLLHGGSPDVADAQGDAPSQLAKKEGHFECVALLNRWQAQCSLADKIGVGTRQSPSLLKDGSGARPMKVQRSGRRHVMTLSCCFKPVTVQVNAEDGKAPLSPPYGAVAEEKRGGRRKPGPIRRLDFSAAEASSDNSLGALVEELKKFQSESEESFVTARELETTVSELVSGDGREITAENFEFCRRLPDQSLRSELEKFGVDVGPITGSTRWLYERRLAELRSGSWRDASVQCGNKGGKKYSYELEQFMKGNLDESFGLGAERALSEFFSRPSTQERAWREGCKKTSFCYLLLDSSVTRDLPNRRQELSRTEIFRRFVDAIFYIGKGKQSRPYQHLKEASELQARLIEGSPDLDEVGSKFGRILDLWGRGGGVVSVHVFQNSLPVEAYTREAAMIDAVGLRNLTNSQKGSYYGPAALWSFSQRRQFGVLNLKRALEVLLVDGERPLFPSDVS